MAQHVYKELNSVNHLDDVINLLKKNNVACETEVVRTALNTAQVFSVIKYQSFQYKLMYNAVLLNNRLFHFQVTDTQLCDFCKKHKEMYEHFFKECAVTSRIWNNLSKIYDFPFHNLTFKDIMLNKAEGERISSYINLIILLTKFKLYSAKCQKIQPNHRQIVNEVNLIQKMESMNAKTSKQVKTYCIRWNTEAPSVNIDANSVIIDYIMDM